MKGKKVGNWLGGNEFELFAALDEERHGPDTNKGVTIVQQPFDMNLFLKRQVDSASAMTYNELAQVLETKNPKTGKLYTLERPERDQDAERRHGDARGRHLHRPATWLKDPANQATAKSSSSKASFQGWIYCRDHAGDCVEHRARRTARRCRRATRPGR